MTADGKGGSSSSSSSAAVSGSSEKPHHYSYLKEFRVEQCPLFLQHKCTQHRPFTCFHWHFMNQRRRRPVRKRDGAFSYSPDVYCTSYDETTGICPDGDDCALLHRTAGDTERRYHLRYFKTAPCVHETDSRGHCVKNGVHCAFSHGVNDLRPPVFDAKEIDAFTGHRGGEEGSTSSSSSNGLLPNNLDNRDRGLAEDPKWQCTTFVLTNYKTDQCRRPPRLCRQGYACPQYHNNKDRRRSPKTFKYRSTPCPNVKHGDEWGEPANCENGDQCGYCHTRTEQQFHPEIYKSTKCNDMLQTGYCPRGPFCAFAHIDEEINSFRDSMSEPTGNDEDHSLSGFVNNALPSDGNGGQLAGTPTSGNNQSANGPNDVAMQNSTNSGEKEVEIDVFNIATVATQGNSGNSIQGRRRAHSGNSNFQHNQISAEDSFSSSDLSSSGNWQSLWPTNKMDLTAGMRREILEIENDLSLNEAEKCQRKQEVFQRRQINNGVSVPHRQHSLSTGSNNSVFAPRHHRLSSTSSGISSSSALGGSGSPLNAYLSLGDTVESVLANGLEDLDIDDLNIENIEVEQGVQDPSEEPNSASSSFSASFGSPMGLALGRSLPISIPDGAMLTRPQVATGTSGPPGFGEPGPALSTSAGASSMSPLSTVAMNVASMQQQQQPALRQRAFSLGQQHAPPTMQQIRDTIAAAGLLGQPNQGRFGPSAGLSPGSGNGNQSSPLLSSSLFTLPQGLQRGSGGSLPDHAGNIGAADLIRLQEEVLSSRSTLAAWEESMLQARKACEAWKKEAEESKLLMGKVEADKMMALQQRDEAAGRCASLMQELDRVGVTNQHMKCLQRHDDLENIPVQQVLMLQQQLRQDLERIEKTLYHHAGGSSQPPPPGFAPQQQQQQQQSQQQQQTQASGNNPPVSSS